MAFKMKGPSLYSKTPLLQKVDPNNDGNDDQSKEAAIKKGDACAMCGKLKGNHGSDHAFTTAAQLNEQDNKELDRKEDAEGKGKGSNRKVMKDGYVNPTQKKKLADNKAKYDALTDAEKKALQEKANAKRKAFEATNAYKKRRANADAKNKKVSQEGELARQAKIGENVDEID